MVNWIFSITAFYKRKDPEQIHIASNILKIESLNQINTESNVFIADMELYLSISSVCLSVCLTNYLYIYLYLKIIERKLKDIYS